MDTSERYKRDIQARYTSERYERETVIVVNKRERAEGNFPESTIQQLKFHGLI